MFRLINRRCLVLTDFIRWQESWLTLIPQIDLKALDYYVLSQFFRRIEVRKKLFCYRFSVSKSAYLENLLTRKVRLL